MKTIAKNILETVIASNSSLSDCTESLVEAFGSICECYRTGAKLLVCGNGGSASDTEHIVGELMKSFRTERPVPSSFIESMFAVDNECGEEIANCLEGAFPAISLVSQTSLITAYINDRKADMVFAQQVYGYAKTGDILLTLSTSGNSLNVINAAKVAKALGLIVIGFTGESGGKLEAYCDVCIKVPSNETYRIQELQQPLYHALCAMVEVEFFFNELI